MSQERASRPRGTARPSRFDLELVTSRINSYLRNIKVKPSGRYGYIAIDVVDDQGRVLATLIAGLTKKEALEFLDALEQFLRLYFTHEKHEG